MNAEEQKLRDEFERNWVERAFDSSLLVRNENTGDYCVSIACFSWEAWKAAHAKYAPRWLPIDEAAMDGRLVDVWSPSVGRWIECRYDQISGGFRSMLFGCVICDAVHYMPIPDAPEVGT